MKHAYIILDYTKSGSNSGERARKIKQGYIDHKNTTDTTIALMIDPIGNESTLHQRTVLKKACEFIESKARTWRNMRIKIVVAGHGQIGVNGGLVGGQNATDITTPVNRLIYDVWFIMSQTVLRRCYPRWEIKMCVCYAARRASQADRTIRNQVNATYVKDTLAGQMAYGLEKIGAKNFKLTAYYTPVRHSYGHHESDSESHTIFSIKLTSLKRQLDRMKPLALAFWRPTNTGEIQQVLSSFFLDFSIEIGDGNGATADMTIVDLVEWEQRMRYKYPGAVISAHKFLADSKYPYFTREEIISFRIMALALDCRSYSGDSRSKPNKMTIACANGNIKFTSGLREGPE
jgi:hypothetical protein